jgi:ferritin
MNKITFTKHAEKKFEYLRELNIHLEVKDIEAAIFKPGQLSEDSLNQVKIVLKRLNNLNLRVIYSDRGGIIRVITFYPVEKGRYRR